MKSINRVVNPQRLVYIPFCKTECGTDFYINTGDCREIAGVLTENRRFETDFFEFFFFRKGNGYLLLETRKLELKDNMVLLLSPHQQQEWVVDESQLDYKFLIFREDFMRTFIADKFFMYRLLYCYQTDTPPCFVTEEPRLGLYGGILSKIKSELVRPVADSYHIIVSLLYYLLMLLNREYAGRYELPVDLPKNSYAFQFKELLETYIYEKQRVDEYAGLLHISRVTLNHAVKAQFGVSANHLLKQRLLAALKNEFLFSNRSITQLADLFHFSDASHLMRFFKQQTGKTFTQYYRDYQAGEYE